MKTKQQTLLALHAAIVDNVRRRCRTLPKAEAEDVASEAYERSSARLAFYSVKRNEAALMGFIARNAVKNVLRDRKRGNKGLNASMARLDATPDVNEDGEADEKAENDYLSDNGRGVARIVAEADGEADREPDWVYAVRIERAKLNGKERAIANGLADGLSVYTLRHKLGLNLPAFWVKMKNLQSRFRPCFIGYREWSRGRR